MEQRTSTWLINPFDDIPGEGLPPLRYWSLARELATRGHIVSWWTASWSHRRKARRGEPDDSQGTDGFSVRMVPVRAYRRNISIARMRSHGDFGRGFEQMASDAIRSREVPRPDIVLASLPPFESCEAALQLANAVGATFVIDVMDLWPETFVRLLPRAGGVRRVAAPVLFGGMARHRDALLAAADAISAPCRAYADSAAGKALADAPRHICYHGCDIEEFPRLAAASGGSTTTLECVYAGSLEASQDIEILPGVAKRLSERCVAATIQVAGTGSREAALRRAAGQLQGSCQIVVHGLLDRQAYIDLLSRCQVGLVCVKPESMVAMPYKAGDYAAAGLAVVNSLPGELSDMLCRYQAGVPYVAENPGALAAAIAYLAADRTRLAAMQKAARQMADEEFDRRKTYAAFADWIEAVHSRGRAASRA